MYDHETAAILGYLEYGASVGAATIVSRAIKRITAKTTPAMGIAPSGLFVKL